MQIQHVDYYSNILCRNMPCKIYGHAGRPVLFVPCQDGKHQDFEAFNMHNEWSRWIDEGKVMVFSIDSIDEETWSDKNAYPYDRVRRHEQWIHFIVDEFVGFIRKTVNDANGWTGFPGIIVFGCSMGATHAVNLYFRFPDIFDGCLALSGIYYPSFFIGDYMDEVVYQNSPVHFLGGMPKDHPYIARYNNNKGIICVGQGAWEEPASTRDIDAICRQKGINVWVDYWGEDVNHDWPWWYKQVQYFVPKLLGEE